MNELERVEQFFKGEMPDQERYQFEQELTANQALASAAAFYLQAKAAVREEILAEKRKQWEQAEPSLKVVRTNWLRVASSIAAILVVVIGTWFIVRPNEPSQERLVAIYIQEVSQTTEPLTMSGGPGNELQKGIDQYNQGKLQEAYQTFTGLLHTPTYEVEAQKLAGLSALRLGKYDQAIGHFQKLSQRTDLLRNFGPYFEALTRLKRNQPDDSKKAKALLERVIKEDPSHKTHAKRLLNS